MHRFEIDVAALGVAHPKVLAHEVDDGAIAGAVGLHEKSRRLVDDETLVVLVKDANGQRRSLRSGPRSGCAAGAAAFKAGRNVKSPRGHSRCDPSAASPGRTAASPAAMVEDRGGRF